MRKSGVILQVVSAKRHVHAILCPIVALTTKVRTLHRNEIETETHFECFSVFRYLAPVLVVEKRVEEDEIEVLVHL